MTDHIKIDVDGPVLHIKIDRPEKRNALTQAMYTSMIEGIDQAEADDAIRAVLFSGTPGFFSAGHDIQDFMAGGLSEDSPVLNFLRRLTTTRKALVAGVSGKAIGIGTTLLLHCDLVYADASASFKLPFVDLGLVPEAASSLILPHTAGHRLAARLLMLGESFDVKTAYDAGIISHPIDTKTGALEAALAGAHTLAAKPPAALRKTRALLRGASNEAVVTRMNQEAKLFVECLASEEAGEAFSAFMQRRRPDFSRFV